MPRKSRKNKATQDNEQEKQQSRFTWTEPMVHAALDEAIQQDCLKKRAGQGFKAEAMLVITAAVQEKVDAELGIRVTTNQVETKLDTERDVLEIIDDEPEDDRVEEPDSQGQISTPPQPQPKAQKSSKSDSKKRAAEESLNNGRPKRERSNVSNELRSRVKLIDHTVKTSLTPHEQAFEMLMTQYKEQVDGLSDQGTTKGKHFCMLAPTRTAQGCLPYQSYLLGEGIMAFVAEANAVVPDVHDIGFLYGT
ncbi:hypothetical protein V8E54_011076 [Elaphomyces granulatus]